MKTHTTAEPKRIKPPVGVKMAASRGLGHRKVSSQNEPIGVPPIVRQVLNSSGQPLDLATRVFMERRFGHDFSNVRIHADNQAAESASVINARAFAVGNDIVFGNGRFRPENHQERMLLAHELAHVTQQKDAGLTSNSLRIGNENDRTEVEADRLASQVMTGKTAEMNAVGDSCTVRRQPVPKVAKDPYAQALAQIQGIDAEIYKYLSAAVLNGGSKTVRQFQAIDSSTKPPTNVQVVFNLDVKQDPTLAKGTDAVFDSGVPAIGGSGANQTFTASMTMSINPAATAVSLAQKLYHEGIHMILFVEDFFPSTPPSPHATSFANYNKIAKGHKDFGALAGEIEAFVKAAKQDPAKAHKAASEIPAHIIEEKYVFDQEKAHFSAAGTNKQIAFTYLMEGLTGFGVTAQLSDKNVISIEDKATAILDEIDKQVAAKPKAAPSKTTAPK
jgi:Zn-dependent peptidase ImmA (M78 family)